MDNGTVNEWKSKLLGNTLCMSGPLTVVPLPVLSKMQMQYCGCGIKKEGAERLLLLQSPRALASSPYGELRKKCGPFPMVVYISIELVVASGRTRRFLELGFVKADLGQPLGLRVIITVFITTIAPLWLFKTNQPLVSL